MKFEVVSATFEVAVVKFEVEIAKLNFKTVSFNFKNADIEVDFIKSELKNEAFELTATAGFFYFTLFPPKSAY